MGLKLSHRDNAATMMDMPRPLLVCHPLPLRGLPLQREDRTAGKKNAAESATTAAKVGIVAASLPLGFGGVAKRGGGLQQWQQQQQEEDMTSLALEKTVQH
jgi:hypothetical protein